MNSGKSKHIFMWKFLAGVGTEEDELEKVMSSLRKKEASQMKESLKRQIPILERVCLD